MQAATGRLAWRCRRGMRELDVLLAWYLRERWAGADAAEKRQFERILELSDPLLAAYLLGRESAPDPDMERMLEILRGNAARPLAGSPAAGPASR